MSRRHLTAVPPATPPVSTIVEGEHPMETARRALKLAALMETGRWQGLCSQMAEVLPPRPPRGLG